MSDSPKQLSKPKSLSPIDRPKSSHKKKKSNQVQPAPDDTAGAVDEAAILSALQSMGASNEPEPKAPNPMAGLVYTPAYGQADPKKVTPGHSPKVTPRKAAAVQPIYATNNPNNNFSNAVVDSKRPAPLNVESEPDVPRKQRNNKMTGPAQLYQECASPASQMYSKPITIHTDPNNPSTTAVGNEGARRDSNMPVQGKGTFFTGSAGDGDPDYDRTDEHEQYETEQARRGRYHRQVSVLGNPNELPEDYSIHFFPRMLESHLENYYLLEVFVHCFGGCCQAKRNRQLLLLRMHGFLNHIAPILGLLWCASMVLSLGFFIDELPTKYFYSLLFSGIYPFLRLCFASVPLLRVLFSSFETWFLMGNAVLLFAALGALVGWDSWKFGFMLICLFPGITQMIVLDSNMTSVLYSCFAMVFSSAYMIVFAILLGTGRIVSADVSLDFKYFNVSLIDFSNGRLITLIIFLLKNTVMLAMAPKSYIQIKSRVFKEYIPTLENRISIA